jgi:hypothetical protein
MREDLRILREVPVVFERVPPGYGGQEQKRGNADRDCARDARSQEKRQQSALTALVGAERVSEENEIDGFCRDHVHAPHVRRERPSRERGVALVMGENARWRRLQRSRCACFPYVFSLAGTHERARMWPPGRVVLCPRPMNACPQKHNPVCVTPFVWRPSPAMFKTVIHPYMTLYLQNTPPPKMEGAAKWHGRRMTSPDATITVDKLLSAAGRVVLNLRADPSSFKRTWPGAPSRRTPALRSEENEWEMKRRWRHARTCY